MDMISRMLDTIRVRAPLLARLRMGGDVSIDMLEGAGSPFHYVISGSATLGIGDDVFRLAAGDIAIVPTWDRHSLSRGAGSKLQSILDLVEDQGLPLWSMKEGLEAPLSIDVGQPPFDTVVVSGNFAMDPEEGAFLARSLPPAISFSTDDLVLRSSVQTAIALVQGIQTAEPGYAAVAARALELLFIQGLRRWLIDSEHATGWARGIAHGNVRRALEAMYENPGREWDLQSLAEHARQSRSAFAEAFREAMGETPFAHLRRYRMNRAAVQLRNSDTPVSKIAAELGYSSSYSFIRAFRQERKISPSRYRKSAKTAGDRAFC